MRSGSLTGEDEDAGADDGADAEGGQVERAEHALELRVAGRARLQLVDGLGREEAHDGYNGRRRP